MAKFSTSKAVTALLLLTTIIAIVQGLPSRQAQVAKRETDVSDDPPKQILTNRQRRSPRPQRHHHHRQHGGPPQSGPPQGGYFPYGGQNYAQQPGFPLFQQQNANGDAVAQNQNAFYNQNAGANTHSSNIQNQFGQFQNNGGSSISSNLANNGQSGQLSSANTDQQSYLTALGYGNKNNAQSQSANFDPFGNLQTSNSNAGILQNYGPNGGREQAFGSANANEQNKFGSSNSGAQTNVEKFNENGVQGEKASSSSFSNNVNNGGFNGNSGTNAGSNSGIENGNAAANAGAGGYNFGGFGGFGRKRRAADDSVVFPKTEESEQSTQNAQGAQQNVVGVVNATNSNQNSTQPEDLESRFGLLSGLLGGGGARAPGPFQQIIGGLVNGIGGGGQYYPQQGGYYPQQGGYYPQQGGYYPPQGGYYPQQGGYYPQPGFGAYPQPGFGPGGFVGRG